MPEPLIKKIRIEDAAGTRLAQDITEICPQEFKGPAFREGHAVCAEDLCRPQKLGKNHLYVLEIGAEEIHENEVAALAAFNLVDEVMCATLHSHSSVAPGKMAAATRAIPLVMKRAPIERAAAIARQEGVVQVRALRRAKAGVVITGSEVYHGLIQDRFAPLLTKKIRSLGGEVASVRFAPDDTELIRRAIDELLAAGCDLLLLSGGMSVDPDDVTRLAIREAGAREIHYRAAALPEAMFLVAWIGDTPLLGAPACGLYRATVRDLILPRILAGERIGKKELAFPGHGGLCQDCKPCRFPHCAFGKGA